MNNPMRKLSIFIALIAALTLLQGPCGAADEAITAPCIKYTVSEQLVTIVSAVTPYDSNPKARDAFLHWFKRGFNTILANAPPLMVEWQNSLEGNAARSGYHFGMDEAERYLKQKKADDHSLQTTPIPAN